MNSTEVPTFSVVMPAHNSQETIISAINSVLGQTRADFELIIVDDGSTDETVSRVQPFLQDARIRFMTQPNLGPAAARNAALGIAQGKYVSLLDSDDVWLPHYLETMARTLDAHEKAAVAYTDAWVLDDTTHAIARVTAMGPWHPPTVPSDPHEFFRTLLEYGNYVFVGTMVYRSVFDNVGTFRLDLKRSTDYDMWLRIASRGYGFVRCPQNLAIYRRTPGQLSADTRTMFLGGREVYRLFAEEYDVPEEVREHARRRIRDLDRLIAAVETRRPRRIPKPLERPYKALSRLRHFYIIPPSEIRRAFPDLNAL